MDTRNRDGAEEQYRPIAWKYFKLHANQRITLFRFYIIFFSLFAVVIGHLISEFHFASTYQEVIVIVLSLVFIGVSIIFWLIDRRNRYLIHNSEDYFLEYEKIFQDNGELRFKKEINSAAIFTKERNEVKESGFRHTHCFNFIYLIAIILSLFFIAFSIYTICHPEDKVYYQIKILPIDIDKDIKK